MNRSESKYFATAEKMDKALLMILEKKVYTGILYPGNHGNCYGVAEE